MALKSINRGMGSDSKSLKTRAESLESAFVSGRPQVLLANLEGVGRARIEVLGVLSGLLDSATFLLRINRWSVADDGVLVNPNGQFLMYVLDGTIIAFQDTNQAPLVPDEWLDEYPVYEIFGTQS
jgi:hypothetical protein